MSYYALIITILLLIPYNVVALNILGIFPYQGKSHFIVFKVYLEELAKRGHNVTVISHFPQSKSPERYYDISLAGSLNIIENNIPFHKSYWTLLGTGFFLTNSAIDSCEIMLANKDVQNLVRSKQNFDVIVVEQFNSDCALGVAYKLNPKTPVVGVVSHILMPWHYNRFGIPSNPSFVSFHFLEGGTKPTLMQRVERTILDVYFKSIYYFLSQRRNQQTLAKHYDDIPPLEDLGREIKFLLLYHNFILTGSSLFPANIIEVGGYHVKEAKPLTGDLLKFVEEAENGVIYISYGSVVKGSTMPDDKLNAVLGTIRELPYRFIWKWENTFTLMDKNKLYTSDWLPQVDILGHPKTLAFLSHAGMGGTTEAIHFGVPMIAMPVVGDQPANAAAIEESGLGIQLQISDLTKENLVNAFKKILDPTFREKVKLISKAWHDRPLSPIDSAIYWTEYAARYSNLTFRTAAADVPCYQYYNIDVIGVYMILLLVVMYSFKCIMCKLFCNRKSITHQQASINKNKKRKKRE